MDELRIQVAVEVPDGLFGQAAVIAKVEDAWKAFEAALAKATKGLKTRATIGVVACRPRPRKPSTTPVHVQIIGAGADDRERDHAAAPEAA